MNCIPNTFSLPEILVLAGTADADGMAPPTSTRISARLKRVQVHSSRVHTILRVGDAPVSVAAKSRSSVSHISVETIFCSGVLEFCNNARGAGQLCIIG